MLYDVHCHINSLSSQRIKDLSLYGDYIFIDSGVNLTSSLASLEICRTYPLVYTSLGFHPFWGKEFKEDIISEYQNLIKNNSKVLAIGEVGLDYKADISLKEQEKILNKFIKLALENKLPLVIHNRLNSPRILEILNNFYTSYQNIIFYCFSYDINFLKKNAG